jgi:hypothetical protein
VHVGGPRNGSSSHWPASKLSSTTQVGATQRWTRGERAVNSGVAGPPGGGPSGAQWGGPAAPYGGTAVGAVVHYSSE